MQQEEIFQILGEATLKSVESIEGWSSAILYIERQEKSVGFKSSYKDENGKEIRVDTEADYFASKAVKQLYNFTSDHPLEHKDWNKAIFTVTPDSKFNIQYIWDQELQDEVDEFNRQEEERDPNYKTPE